MPRFSVFIATSLDGFIARQDGGIDWLARVELPGEDYGFAEFLGSVDTMVMGRGTYDVVRRFASWAYSDQRVIVLTHRPLEAPAHGETHFAGSAVELAATLADAKRVYLDGGNVIRQFLAADLVDDLTVSIVPIVLGDGVPLFGRETGEHTLVLREHRAWSSGLVQLRYERARK